MSEVIRLRIDSSAPGISLTCFEYCMLLDSQWTLWCLHAYGVQHAANIVCRIPSPFREYTMAVISIIRYVEEVLFYTEIILL